MHILICKEEKKKKHEMEDWDSTIQKQNKEKELELKQIPKSGPETMPSLETEDTKVHTQQLINNLIGNTKEISKEEEQKDGSHDSDDSEVFEDYSDDTIDNIV